MSKANFAFVRNLKTSGGGNLKSFSQIQSAESHAKRLDLTSQDRQVKGRSEENNYFWSKAGEGLEEGGADYTKAYRAHKKEFGIKTERKGAAMAQHLLVGVSPEWLAEAGDARDLNNPRVRQLIEEAKTWAESWMGEGAVWAVRYDTDEKGAGVVDILSSPIREQRHKSGSSKPSISVNKANTELADKHGLMKGWEAMQSDWAQHAQKTLDKSLKRGIPKKKTNRENIPPEAYATAVERAVKDKTAELDQQKEKFYEDALLLQRQRNGLLDLAKERRDFEEVKRANAADLEKTMGQVTDALQHLENAVDRVQRGSYDTEIFLQDMPNYPHDFSVLKASAPDHKPTFGFRNQFWALNYVDTGQPIPLPEKIRSSLTKAFDRVTLWASEVSKGRQEARKAQERLSGAFEAARASGYEEGRLQGLSEVTDAKVEVKQREVSVEKREQRLEKQTTESLSLRETFFERGFSVLTDALRKKYTPETNNDIAKAYEDELASRSSEKPTPQNLSPNQSPGR